MIQKPHRTPETIQNMSSIDVFHIVEAAETSVVVAHVALDLPERQVHRTDFSGCMTSTKRVSGSFEPETVLHVHHAVPGKIMAVLWDMKNQNKSSFNVMVKDTTFLEDCPPLGRGAIAVEHMADIC